MSQMKEKLLKIENRIIDQDETIANAAVYANVEIFETFNRIKTIKNQMKKMSWRIVHDEISRSNETNNKKFDLYQCINEIIEWLNRDFSMLMRD